MVCECAASSLFCMLERCAVMVFNTSSLQVCVLLIASRTWFFKTPWCASFVWSAESENPSLANFFASPESWASIFPWTVVLVVSPASGACPHIALDVSMDNFIARSSCGFRSATAIEFVH